MSDKPNMVLGIRTLYHASTLGEMNNILEMGIDPKYQSPSRRLDFGRGFYTTSQITQAQEFAVVKQETRVGALGAILEFRLTDDFWTGLRGIEFRLRGEANWAKFVMGYRTGEPAPSDPSVDYIFGPVADNLRLMKTAGELPTPIKPRGRAYYDQIAFHSEEAACRLNDLLRKGECYLWVWSNGNWIRRHLIRN